MEENSSYDGNLRLYGSGDENGESEDEEEEEDNCVDFDQLSHEEAPILRRGASLLQEYDAVLPPVQNADQNLFSEYLPAEEASAEAESGQPMAQFELPVAAPAPVEPALPPPHATKSNHNRAHILQQQDMGDAHPVSVGAAIRDAFSLLVSRFFDAYGELHEQFQRYGSYSHVTDRSVEVVDSLRSILRAIFLDGIALSLSKRGHVGEDRYRHMVESLVRFFIRGQWMHSHLQVSLCRAGSNLVVVTALSYKDLSHLRQLHHRPLGGPYRPVPMESRHVQRRWTDFAVNAGLPAVMLTNVSTQVGSNVVACDSIHGLVTGACVPPLGPGVTILYIDEQQTQFTVSQACTTTATGLTWVLHPLADVVRALVERLVPPSENEMVEATLQAELLPETVCDDFSPALMTHDPVCAVVRHLAVLLAPRRIPTVTPLPLGSYSADATRQDVFSYFLQMPVRYPTLWRCVEALLSWDDDRQLPPTETDEVAYRRLPDASEEAATPASVYRAFHILQLCMFGIAAHEFGEEPVQKRCSLLEYMCFVALCYEGVAERDVLLRLTRAIAPQDTASVIRGVPADDARDARVREHCVAILDILETIRVSSSSSWPGALESGVTALFCAEALRQVARDTQCSRTILQVFMSLLPPLAQEALSANPDGNDDDDEAFATIVRLDDIDREPLRTLVTRLALSWCNQENNHTRFDAVLLFQDLLHAIAGRMGGEVAHWIRSGTDPALVLDRVRSWCRAPEPLADAMSGNYGPLLSILHRYQRTDPGRPADADDQLMALCPVVNASSFERRRTRAPLTSRDATYHLRAPFLILHCTEGQVRDHVMRDPSAVELWGLITVADSRREVERRTAGRPRRPSSRARDQVQKVVNIRHIGGPLHGADERSLTMFSTRAFLRNSGTAAPGTKCVFAFFRMYDPDTGETVLRIANFETLRRDQRTVAPLRNVIQYFPSHVMHIRPRENPSQLKQQALRYKQQNLEAARNTHLPLRVTDLRSDGTAHSYRDDIPLPALGRFVNLHVRRLLSTAVEHGHITHDVSAWFSLQNDMVFGDAVGDYLAADEREGGVRLVQPVVDDHLAALDDLELYHVPDAMPADDAPRDIPLFEEADALPRAEADNAHPTETTMDAGPEAEPPATEHETTTGGETDDGGAQPEPQRSRGARRTLARKRCEGNASGASVENAGPEDDVRDARRRRDQDQDASGRITGVAKKDHRDASRNRNALRASKSLQDVYRRKEPLCVPSTSTVSSSSLLSLPSLRSRRTIATDDDDDMHTDRAADNNGACPPAEEIDEEDAICQPPVVVAPQLQPLPTTVAKSSSAAAAVSLASGPAIAVAVGAAPAASSAAAAGTSSIVGQQWRNLFAQAVRLPEKRQRKKRLPYSEASVVQKAVENAAKNAAKKAEMEMKKRDRPEDGSRPAASSSSLSPLPSVSPPATSRASLSDTGMPSPALIRSSSHAATRTNKTAAPPQTAPPLVSPSPLTHAETDPFLRPRTIPFALRMHLDDLDLEKRLQAPSHGDSATFADGEDRLAALQRMQQRARVVAPISLRSLSALNRVYDKDDDLSIITTRKRRKTSELGSRDSDDDSTTEVGPCW